MWEQKDTKMLGVTSEPIVNIKKDMNYCTAINRHLLTLLGIWPFDNRVITIYKIVFGIRIIICYSLMLFINIPMILYILLEEMPVQRIFQVLAPIIYQLCALIKYNLFLIKRNDIRECLDHIFIDWQRFRSPEDHKIMLNAAKYTRFIISGCAVIIYSCLVLFRIIMPGITMWRAAANNITLRIMPLPIYKPLFSADSSPNYEIVYIMQFISGIIASSITISTIGVVAMFVNHACGQFEIIISKLNGVIKKAEDAGKIYNNALDEIIEIHIRALSFIVRIEHILNDVCFVEFFGSMSNICFFTYNLMMHLDRAEILGSIIWTFIVSSFIFNIFVFCYIGELLTTQGEKVGIAAYMIEWYKLPKKHTKSLIFLLSMANRPCNITAGKIANLSCRSFTFIVKTSMGYINLLHTITM